MLELFNIGYKYFKDHLNNDYTLLHYILAGVSIRL